MSAPASESDLSIIYDGATVTNLAAIFNLDTKTVQKRLNGRVAPVKSKDKYVRYRIREAAPYLCDAKIDYEELIKTLTPSKMPPMLQDGFWKAQNSRLTYLERRGELWDTRRVFEVVATAFKSIRVTILMFVDTVEKQTKLTEQQRQIVQRLGDGLLHDLEQSLRDEFAFYEEAVDEHGPPVTDDTPIPQTGRMTDDGEVVEEEDPFV